jgi:predicted nucleic acid-binding protein
MATGKPRIYWEPSVFISWLKGGVDRTPEEMQGIEVVARQMAVGQLQLITSVISEIEILESKFTEEQRKKIESVLRNPNNCVQVNVDPFIARLARTYREQFKLKTPDAIHLATAVITGCKEFHSFDPHHLKLKGQEAFSAVNIQKPPLNAPLFEPSHINALPELSGTDEKEENSE